MSAETSAISSCARASSFAALALPISLERALRVSWSVCNSPMMRRRSSSRATSPAAVPAKLLSRAHQRLIESIGVFRGSRGYRAWLIDSAPGLTSPDRRQLRQISASRAASASARFFSTILTEKMLAS